jgi:hypothetical protein
MRTRGGGGAAVAELRIDARRRSMVRAHSLCGGTVEILACWTYSEGSTAEAIGTAEGI